MAVQAGAGMSRTVDKGRSRERIQRGERERK